MKDRTMYIHWQADEDFAIVSLYTTDEGGRPVTRKVALKGKEERFLIEFSGDAKMCAHKQIRT